MQVPCREVAMKFTQSQVLRLSGVSRETLRHWKRTLEVLRDRKGRSEQYSGGDALALSVLQRLTGALQVQISSLNPVGGALFSACQGVQWSKLSAAWLAIDFDRALVTIERTALTQGAGRIVIALRVDDLIADLQGKLLGNEGAESMPLMFAPVGLAKRHQPQ